MRIQERKRQLLLDDRKGKTSDCELKEEELVCISWRTRF